MNAADLVASKQSAALKLDAAEQAVAAPQARQPVVRVARPRFRLFARKCR